MADASFLQTSFLGGEWSPLVQGNAIDPNYKRGMNLCRNGLPIEEGAVTRRPGFRLIAALRGGAQGVYRAFEFKQNAPYLLELTGGHLRFVAGASLVTEGTSHAVASVSAANPAVIQTGDVHGYTTGDQVLLAFDPADPGVTQVGLLNFTVAPLLGRELTITVVDTTHFSVKDAVSGASIDGSTITLGSSKLDVRRIVDIATSYATADLAAINTVQDQANLLLLHNAYAPEWLQSTAAPGASTFATFSYQAAAFHDGPYQDPVSDGTTVTLSATSGSVTATLAGGATRFAATDVGRMIRFFSEPALWLIGTAYTVGQQVKYNGAYYQALKANTGKQPDVDVINWGVATGAAVWNFGTITAFTDATHATLTLSVVTNPDGTLGPVLTGTSIASGNWRLGLYSATTGYPTCGVYHGGRLWLAGSVGNRLDGSVSNGLPSSLNGNVFDFTPTAADGTVADNNACQFVFNATDVNQIFWMVSDNQGIIAGTQAGEWLVRASANNDAITPTSVDARRVSTYGAANVPAKRASMPIIFVQRYAKKLLEYITTDFRGLVAKNISMTGKHLTTKSGIAEIGYQKEKVPVVWARTNDGTLLGCTFRRESPWASDPPDFAGWHAHSLNGMTVNSLQVGPSFDGTLDALSLVVKRASDGLYYGLQSTDLFDVDYGIGDACFVDFASSPVMVQYTAGTPATIKLYGLWRLAGQNVDVFLGGVDCGTLAVGADGTLSVQVDGNVPLLTSAWLATLQSSIGSTNFHGLGVAIQTTPPVLATFPATAGMLQFDTTLGGVTYNGVAIPDWDTATFLTSSAISGAVATWDMTATNTPPTRTHFHATNATQGLQVGCRDSLGNWYIGYPGTAGALGVNKLSVDLQTSTLTSIATTVATTNFQTNWINVFLNGQDYLVSSAGTEVDLIQIGSGVPTLKTQVIGAVTEQLCGLLARKVVSSPSQVQLWLLGTSHTTVNYDRQGQNLGLYLVSINAGVPPTVTVVRKLSITPQMFNPLWTHFTAGVDILGDEADGNPIIWAQSAPISATWAIGTTYAQFNTVDDTNTNHDYESLQNANTGNAPAIGGTAFWRDLGVHQAVSEQNFIKVNVATGLTQWTAKPAGGLFGYREQNRVRFGKLRVFDVAGSSHLLWDIDTLNATGTLASTATVLGVVPSASKQFYNDKTGEWISNLSYSFAAGTPVQVGNTAASFNDWGILGPAAGWTYPLVPAPAAAVFETVPMAIGYTYESDFQILRVILPQEAGAQNGPALGKTRRTQHYAALMQQTQGINFGTDFATGTFHRAAFTSKGGTPLALTSLYSGVLWEPIEATEDFDNMIAWKITRPYPATVCSLSGFLHTQDR